MSEVLGSQMNIQISVSTDSSDTFSETQSPDAKRRRSASIEKYDMRRNSLTGSMKCPECSLMVYTRDPQVVFDGSIYHTSCARCKDCGILLNINNIRKAPDGNSLLCETHYKKRILHRSTAITKITSAKKAKVKGGDPTSTGSNDVFDDPDEDRKTEGEIAIEDALASPTQPSEGTDGLMDRRLQKSTSSDDSYETSVDSYWRLNRLSKDSNESVGTSSPDVESMQAEITRLKSALENERKEHFERINLMQNELNMQNELHAKLLGLNALTEKFEEALASGKVEDARTLEAEVQAHSNAYTDHRNSLRRDSLLNKKTGSSVRFNLDQEEDDLKVDRRLSHGEQRLRTINSELSDAKERLQNALTAVDIENVSHAGERSTLPSPEIAQPLTQHSSSPQEEGEALKTRLAASLALIRLLEERLSETEHLLASKEEELSLALFDHRRMEECDRQSIAELEREVSSLRLATTNGTTGHSTLTTSATQTDAVPSTLDAASTDADQSNPDLSEPLPAAQETLSTFSESLSPFREPMPHKPMELGLSALRDQSGESLSGASHQASDRERMLEAEVSALRERLPGASGSDSAPLSLSDEGLLQLALRTGELELSALRGQPGESLSGASHQASDRERMLEAEVSALRERLPGASGIDSAPLSSSDEGLLREALRTRESELSALRGQSGESLSSASPTSELGEEKFLNAPMVSAREIILQSELREKDAVIASLLLQLQAYSLQEPITSRDERTPRSVDTTHVIAGCQDVASERVEEGIPLALTIQTDNMNTPPSAISFAESNTRRPLSVTTGSQTQVSWAGESEDEFSLSTHRPETRGSLTDDMISLTATGVAKETDDPVSARNIAFETIKSPGSLTQDSSNGLCHQTDRDSSYADDAGANNGSPSSKSEGNTAVFENSGIYAVDDPQPDISKDMYPVGPERFTRGLSLRQMSDRLLAASAELSLAKERLRTASSGDDNETLPQDQNAAMIEYYTEQVTRLETELRELKHDLSIAQRTNDESLVLIAELKDRVLRQTEEIEQLRRQNVDKENEILKVLSKYQNTYHDIQMLDHAIIQLTEQIDMSEKVEPKRYFGLF